MIIPQEGKVCERVLASICLGVFARACSCECMHVRVFKGIVSIWGSEEEDRMLPFTILLEW